MGTKTSSATSEKDRKELDEELALRRWAQSSRYLAMMSLRDQAGAINVERAKQPELDRRFWTKARTDALLTALFTILLLAGAAFLAGLL